MNFWKFKSWDKSTTVKVDAPDRWQIFINPERIIFLISSEPTYKVSYILDSEILSLFRCGNSPLPKPDCFNNQKFSILDIRLK